ncbi:type ISP restriction/modification enzyme [Bacteroidota bacterium]
MKESEIAKVRSIKQLRPIVPNQPWAIFWMEFENKKLPVTILRRILKHFVVKKRANDPSRSTWNMEDIMFISAHGEDETRGMTFAHFKTLDDKEVMREFSWDKREKKFEHYIGYLSALQWPEDENDAGEWRNQWRKAFTGSTREAISTSLQLAKAMAWIARDIKGRVLEVYEIEREQGPLHKLLQSFKEELIHSMEISDFADMYAQTITYGLFSARTMDKDGHFELEEVVDLIPNTNPFLKNLFKECIEVGNSKDHIDLDELGVGRLVELLDNLNRSDGSDTMQRILNEFGRQTGGGTEDPVIHFYEGFLKEYDDLKRIERGVYYTPDPVVDFIVRSVNEQLKSEFGLKYGLADVTTWGEMVDSGRTEWPNDPLTGKVTDKWISKIRDIPFVQILDPATGTGTFLKHIITIIHSEVKHKYESENISDSWLDYWNEYVYTNLLSRLYAFELMMASYSVAHMKIGMHLKSLGYKFEKEKRLNIYLTNTLEPFSENSQISMYVSSIGKEALAANQTKQNKIFSVIIGNPPYAVSSRNKGQWIQNLLIDYKKGLNEKKINLDDDYLKFIRYGQYTIDKNNLGVLAYISNNSFIDGITHRQVRKNLVSSFNKIYIIDLHGNANKKEKDSEGGSDENVFDIQQGVSINIFLKSAETQKSINHFDLLGKREPKYNFLINNNIDSINWNVVSGDMEYCFFTSKDLTTDNGYLKYIELSKLFPLSNSGIQTKCDAISISEDVSELKKTVILFQNKSIEELKILFTRKESSGWNFKNAKDDLIKNPSVVFSKYNYRPLDFRYIVYTGTSSGFLGRSRNIVMKHFVNKQNVGLCLMRQFFQDAPYSHIYATNSLIDERTMYSNRGGTYLFPLYTYPESNGQQEIGKKIERVPNLSDDIVKVLSEKLDLTFHNEKVDNAKYFAPIDILDYIYAVLHSPIYREKYKEFLKIDFPRVPYPKDKAPFWKLVKLGGELRQIHLLESPKVEQYTTSYPVDGDHEVVKPVFNEGKVWINGTQYFDGVPEVGWNFYIGGYQPAQKWLKDRKGGKLKKEDIDHYQKIILALTETDRIMNEIDKIEIE